jgi:hypothetical protein
VLCAAILVGYQRRVERAAESSHHQPPAGRPAEVLAAPAG